ncbi:MAG: thioredoxin [Methanobacteriota archaeon]|nr:MAG: thioredoxin [Euryarchaeota archaeon]
MVQDQPVQSKPVQQRQVRDPAVQEKPVLDKPIHVTDDDFDKVVKENRYVVVDFWAEWCRPCHAIAPTIDELAKRYAGKVVFAKINSDENQRKFQEYGVMGIPTLLFFKDGKLVDQVIGAMPKAPLEQRVVKHLA